MHCFHLLQMKNAERKRSLIVLSCLNYNSLPPFLSYRDDDPLPAITPYSINIMWHICNTPHLYYNIFQCIYVVLLEMNQMQDCQLQMQDLS